MSDGPADALRRAKHRIAQSLLGDGAIAVQLGELSLRQHQVTAVTRLREILATFRGALLADAVGLGKTYVALAIAREHPTAMVICPSALRAMWRRAMETARLDLPVFSIESLSRSGAPRATVDLIIIDEAHHLRTPGTRRYDAVADLARHSRVLLLSATPLHNSRRDLTAVLALFAGSTVRDWDDGALARLIVRRDDATAEESLPALSGPRPLTPGVDDDCVEHILGLPPTVPASDEGVAHALTTISLVHLWTSSRAALLASVRKRIARAIALREAVASGHVPTSLELSAWRFADGALQLAFPLFAPGEETIDARALLSQLDAFLHNARALVEHCVQAPDPDDERVRLLRILRERHRGERIVAFSQYANTIAGFGRAMRGDAGVAIVTAEGARIASGALPREEVLAQFSADARPAKRVDRIDLLLTTDLLSEGIDLRGASVIVHLDLPWNPARLEQRVGRSRRIGSRFETIHVYTFLPPAAADRLIELRRRLRDKVRAARAIVGGAFDPFGDERPAPSRLSAAESLRARIRDWLDSSARESGEDCSVAGATGTHDGWIAAVRFGGVTRLIGDVGQGIQDDPALLLQVIDGMGDPWPVSSEDRDAAVAQIREWLAAREAAADLDRQSLAKRAVLDRLRLAVARAPRHRRPAIVAAAGRTRAALDRVTGIGVERALAALARSAAADEAWLQSAEDFARNLSEVQPATRDAGLNAVILLARPTGEGDATPG